MGYKVKWVEDNLGVTRKALRVFEKAGLMPENKGRQYRSYDDDDIDRIWMIRVLQGMGYSIKEIVEMISNEEFDFDTSISQKVVQLEEKMVELKRHLGYAKTIKLTGRFPSRPKRMGDIKFDDFQKNAIDRWNISGDPQEESYAQLAETILSKPTEEWDTSDLGRMISMLEMIKTIDIDLLIAEHVLPKAICKRKALGANHPDVQLMVKLIYENQNVLWQSLGMEDEMNTKQFSRFYSSSFLVGDIAKIKTSEYTEEDCEFIAEAVSVFGGHKNYDELLKEELRYDRRDEGGKENE